MFSINAKIVLKLLFHSKLEYEKSKFEVNMFIKPKIKQRNDLQKLKEERSFKSSKVNRKLKKKGFSLSSNLSIYTKHNIVSN
jgi:hypothetical protein